MRRKGFARRLQNLPKEKQMIALASIVTFISCFLPWYGINSRVINEWWNAFGSIGSVAGYIIASFALLSLAIILFPVLKSDLNLQQRLPMKESSLLVFLNAQSLFVALLFIPVYAQYSLINATNSGSRFGIYLALISTLFGSIVSYSYHQMLSIYEGALSSVLLYSCEDMKTNGRLARGLRTENLNNSPLGDPSSKC